MNKAIMDGMLQAIIIFIQYIIPFLTTALVVWVIKKIIEKFTYDFSTISGDSRRIARKKARKMGNIDDIQMESARLIIEEQWKDIYASKDGMKTFIEIFDDIFTKCINLYKDKFFLELKSTDVLCRAVRDWNHDTDRFIPWPNKTNNRWNPPGKTYLYLSFSEKESIYSDKLSLNEYICLQEIRAEKWEKFSF